MGTQPLTGSPNSPAGPLRLSSATSPYQGPAKTDQPVIAIC